jgi:ribosomal protein S14
MCGHFFMYHDRYQLQRHRPVWRCTTCGRESSAPLDCCGQPDFAPRQSVTLGRQCARWLAETGHWVLTSLGALWRRRRQPVTPLVVPDNCDAEGLAAEAVVIGADDDAETTAVADVPVASGERV